MIGDRRFDFRGCARDQLASTRRYPPLTGALDRDKQLAVVRQLTDIVAAAGGDPTLVDRIWVMLTEAVPGAGGSKATRTPTMS